MKHFILLLFLSVPMMFYAQTVTIEGHIADKLTGPSLPMATVKLSSGAHTISNEYGANVSAEGITPDGHVVVYK